MPCGFTRPTCAPSAVNRSLSIPRRSSHEPSACARAGRAATLAMSRAMTAIFRERVSVRARNTGSGKVRAEDCTKVLTGARAADGAPLTHADAMSVAQPSNRQARESSIGRRQNLGRKIRAVEKLATRRAQHITNVVRLHTEAPARRLQHNGRHSARRRPPFDGDVTHVAHRTCRYL